MLSTIRRALSAAVAAAIDAARNPPQDPKAPATTGSAATPASPEPGATTPATATTPGVATTSPTPAPTPAAAPAESLGIDVSGYQRDIDWAKVAAARVTTDVGDLPVRFVVVKALEGATTPNKLRAAQAKGAQGAGMLVQYYHFARPDLGDPDPVVDAKAEAEAFVKNIRALPAPADITWADGNHCAVWLDVEKAVERYDTKQCAAWVRTWCEHVEAAGFAAGFYSGKAWFAAEIGPWTASLRPRPDGSLRPFWAPSYGADNGKVPNRATYNADRRTPPEFQPAAVWQYTSKGTVAGISGGVDLNLAVVAAVG